MKRRLTSIYFQPDRAAESGEWSVVRGCPKDKYITAVQVPFRASGLNNKETNKALMVVFLAGFNQPYQTLIFAGKNSVGS